MPVVVEGIGVGDVVRPVVAAVAIGIDRVREVEARQIVDEAVAIVVDAVLVFGPRDPVAVEILAWIHPDVRGDIGMKPVEARVDDGDDDPFARRDGPGLGGTDSMQAPEIGVGLGPGAAAVKEGVIE